MYSLYCLVSRRAERRVKEKKKGIHLKEEGRVWM